MITVQTNLHRFLDLGPLCRPPTYRLPGKPKLAFIGDPYNPGDIFVDALIRVTDLSKDFDSRYF